MQSLGIRDPNPLKKNNNSLSLEKALFICKYLSFPESKLCVAFRPLEFKEINIHSDTQVLTWARAFSQVYLLTVS